MVGAATVEPAIRCSLYRGVVSLAIRGAATTRKQQRAVLRAGLPLLVQSDSDVGDGSAFCILAGAAVSGAGSFGPTSTSYALRSSSAEERDLPSDARRAA